MKVSEPIDVKGRGKILLVDYEDGDTVHKIGDTVFYQKNIYEVIGVEFQKLLTYPPMIGSRVGLNIRLIK